MESLKVASLKNIFETLDTETQTKLICDLMKTAKIDSIIGVDRSTDDDYKFADGINKQLFFKYIMPFLTDKFTIVECQFIEKCYKLYQRLEKLTIGCNENACEAGDLYLYAISDNTYDNFKYSLDKELMFRKIIFDDIHLKFFHLAVSYENYEMCIKFQDLMVLMHDNEKMFQIILLIFGYLKDDEKDDAMKYFYEIFPDAKSFTNFNDSTLANLKLCCPELVII
jgi:hypothetical protein